jgi:hypothetical protein
MVERDRGQAGLLELRCSSSRVRRPFGAVGQAQLIDEELDICLVELDFDFGYVDPRSRYADSVASRTVLKRRVRDRLPYPPLSPGAIG